MFGGMVNGIGSVLSVTSNQGCRIFTIAYSDNLTDITLGESIAVNGVCLSVTDFSPTHFQVSAVPETLQRTNLAYLQAGSKVNLEQALRANARIGGHYVQGHIDDVGEIINLEHDQGSAILATIRVKPAIANYLVTKGYVAIDGMSITLIAVSADSFTVTFIPLTQKLTIVQHYAPQQFVNIEIDIMSKYIKKFLENDAHVISH